VFEDFIGNHLTTAAVANLIERDRLPHTLLFHGPEGVGKATLARRMAAVLLSEPSKLEQDDLSRPENEQRILEREKLPSEKRAEDPLLFASHPDFLTFPPEGPLRQISIQQVRLLRQMGQYAPLKGKRKVVLIDHLDRANEQAANSLLKTLEEPPEHLLLLATAENVYDLLPTIRSRSVMFHMTPLAEADMRDFVAARGLDEPERRIALSWGSPGLAVRLDLADYDRRRAAMLHLLEAACRATRFSVWAGQAEQLAQRRAEKLSSYLAVLYGLLGDLLSLREGRTSIRNADVQGQLEALAERVSFEWLREAVRRVDELVHLERRNIQKAIALDALVVGLRERAARLSA
jgi:DNA polymerase-3 subunit delta'